MPARIGAYANLPPLVSNIILTGEICLKGHDGV